MGNMILATHAIAGAAIATAAHAHPLLGFLLGFASHFPLDAVPHWHYRLAIRPWLVLGRQVPRGSAFRRALARDLLTTGTDFALGLGLVAAVIADTPAAVPAALLGALGGVLPDLLHLFQLLLPNRFFAALRKFHRRVHATTRLDDQPLVGISSQMAVIVLAWFLFPASLTTIIST